MGINSDHEDKSAEQVAELFEVYKFTSIAVRPSLLNTTQ